MRLTNNFELLEFIENKWATPDELKRLWGSLTIEVGDNIKELAENLQVLSDHVGNVPITINIAFRPLWWEQARKRSGKSKHVPGKAGDIVVKGMSPSLVYAKIERLISEGKMKRGGLHAYKTFTHYDTRGKNARW